MDYTPRFSQPFTLAEAIRLDVSVTTDEISRLQNSLAHLKDTQRILQAEINGGREADPEIMKAFEENLIVIGSQEERISMLKMALTDKGITSGTHYDSTTASNGTQHASQCLPAAQDHTESDGDGGVFL